VVRDIFSRLGELTLWLLRWYFDRVVTSWHQEVGRLENRDNKWLWIGLCVFFAIFLLPYLTREAFSDSFLLGLSLVWASFLAISFAYILRNPLLMIIVYVGVVFGRGIITLFITAKEEATGGNILGAVIVFCLGIYLITWANRMEKGEV
jgi:hypothetical protein